MPVLQRIVSLLIVKEVFVRVLAHLLKSFRDYKLLRYNNAIVQYAKYIFLQLVTINNAFCDAIDGICLLLLRHFPKTPLMFLIIFTTTRTLHPTSPAKSVT